MKSASISVQTVSFASIAVLLASNTFADPVDNAQTVPPAAFALNVASAILAMAATNVRVMIAENVQIAMKPGVRNASFAMNALLTCIAPIAGYVYIAQTAWWYVLIVTGIENAPYYAVVAVIIVSNAPMNFVKNANFVPSVPDFLIAAEAV